MKIEETTYRTLLHRAITLLFILTLMAFFSSMTQADGLPIEEGSRTLWIGNSLTGSLHGGLAAYVAECLMVSSPSLTIKWDYDLVWGRSLEWQYTNNGTQTQANSLWNEGIYVGWPTTWINAVDAIKHGHPDDEPWNFIVLQGYTDDIFYPDIFFKNVRRFDLVTRMMGAETILFMRWARNPDNVGMATFLSRTSLLEQHYTQIGREIGAPVVPIAVMWRDLITTPGSIFSPSDFWGDVIHQTGVSKGINAYAFYSMLSKRSPVGLDYQYGDYNVAYVENRTSETFELVDNTIQQAVWDVITSRETWDDPGYEEPQPSGKARVFYSNVSGEVYVEISGNVIAVRIGCPQRDYLKTSITPEINGQTPDFMDSEIATWYKETGFTPGYYRLGRIVAPGSPADEIGYAYTPFAGSATGGLVEMLRSNVRIWALY